jgi:hypothetical protein
MCTSKKLRRNEIDPDLHDQILVILRQNKVFAWGEKYNQALEMVLIFIFIASLGGIAAYYTTNLVTYTVLIFFLLSAALTICIYVWQTLYSPALFIGGGHYSSSCKSEHDDSRLYESIQMPHEVRKKVREHLGSDARIEIAHQQLYLKRLFDDWCKTPDYEIYCAKVCTRSDHRSLGTWATFRPTMFTDRTAFK